MWWGHLSGHRVTKFHEENLLTGVKNYKLDLCKFYMLGKHYRVKFNSVKHIIEKILYYVYFDVYGLLEIIVKSKGEESNKKKNQKFFEKYSIQRHFLVCKSKMMLQRG
ncbi:hypothetical protein CR513_30865, partial [Mucuna pruriens]